MSQTINPQKITPNAQASIKRPNRGVITEGLAGGGVVGVDGMGGSLSPTYRQKGLVNLGFTANLRNADRRV